MQSDCRTIAILVARPSLPRRCTQRSRHRAAGFGGFESVRATARSYVESKSSSQRGHGPPLRRSSCAERNSQSSSARRAIRARQEKLSATRTTQFEHPRSPAESAGYGFFSAFPSSKKKPKRVAFLGSRPAAHENIGGRSLRAALGDSSRSMSAVARRSSECGPDSNSIPIRRAVRIFSGEIRNWTQSSPVSRRVELGSIKSLRSRAKC
jgi:hypothetical protein